jgi:peptidoglycan hydrolase-like amidase
MVLATVAPGLASAEHRTVWDTPYPTTIRVAVRESMPSGEPDPLGRILYVKTVDFDEYVVHSLPHEWVPSWHQESVQAGAMAVKMFAWYKILHPTLLDGWEFDLDNTTNFQTYRETGRYGNTDEAHWRVRHLGYALPDGTIVELNYRAGHSESPNWQYRNANMMAQWGSQYWAERGFNMLRILQWYYEGRALHPIPGLQAWAGGGSR